MTPEQVLDYYKSKYNFHKSTKMNVNSLRYWLKMGYIPMPSQYRLEELSNGALKAHFEHCREFNDVNKEINQMNIRGLMKIVGCNVERVDTDAPDNFYTNKISFVYGRDESTRYEHLYFRLEEVEALQKSLEMVSNSIKEYIEN